VAAVSAAIRIEEGTRLTCWRSRPSRSRTFSSHAPPRVIIFHQMSTLQEIKSAIANLSPHDKALLTAELFGTNAEPDDVALEAALERGLKDVEAGRVRPVEEVKTMLPRWTSKS
jgi:hypothetical protein